MVNIFPFSVDIVFRLTEECSVLLYGAITKAFIQVKRNSYTGSPKCDSLLKNKLRIWCNICAPTFGF
jgi:hypothetical protein